MTFLLFPDNTVLCNFAAVDRLDVLRAVLCDRGRWTEAVAYEASRSARYLPPLRRVPREGWLGDAIEVDDTADIAEIERICRAVFGGTDERPLEHLGEAQTCHVILKWSEYAGSCWISDDRESLRYACAQGIATLETRDLVAAAVHGGTLTAADGYLMLHEMVARGRYLRLPSSAAALLPSDTPPA